MLASARTCVGMLVAAISLAPCAPAALAAQATIDRPNQYPSPSVQHTSDDGTFDEDYPWWENTLTGDWGGWRTEMAGRGIVINMHYVSLLMQNSHGGFDTGFVGAGPFAITSTIDTEKLWGHEGGTIFFDWEFNRWYNGPFPPNNTFDPTGSYVGANTNFIDADVAELNQIAQLYYEQSWWHDGATLSFGKLDANVTFASVAAAGAFQNSIAMYTSTLNRFIPTYPNESTALIATLGDENVLMGSFGWFDGTSAAYDPATGISGPDTGPRGPRTFFDNNGHWWIVAQLDAAWHLDLTRPGRMAVGGWIQTGRTSAVTTNVDGSPSAGVTDVPGAYVQWQQVVWAPSADLADDGGGIACFGQFGWSDPNKNPVHWSLMTGVSATGVFPERLADATGIMFAYSDFTNNPNVFRSVQQSGEPGPAGGHEASLESFYLYQWTSWAYFQPGVMWIMSPGAGNPPPLGDALLVYGVMGIEF